MLRACLLLLVVAGCRGESLSGTYEGEEFSLRFEPDGQVWITSAGKTLAATYEVDGERVWVQGPAGRVLYRRDGGTLTGPLGVTLEKR